MYARSRIHTTHTHIHTHRILTGPKYTRISYIWWSPQPRVTRAARGVDRRRDGCVARRGFYATLAAKTGNTSTLLEYTFFLSASIPTYAIVSVYIWKKHPYATVWCFNTRIVGLIRECSLHASYRYRDGSISAINKLPTSNVQLNLSVGLRLEVSVA